ncbi:hypothetical protein ACFL0V_03525 [Nanoarchaeota archaeon]
MAATFSNSKSLRKVDEKLQKAFASINGDMKSIKEGQHQQGVKIAEMKQAVKDAKADLVTVDKFNILKIKLGELNEQMKKVWDNEKKLEDLDRRSVGQSDFDKEAITWNNEIKKLHTDLKKLNKDAASEAQLKDLVKDVNSEFKKTKGAIEDLRNVKDTLTKEEMEKRSTKISNRVKKTEKAVKKFDKELKTRIETKQVESLVDDINSEFDNLKKLITERKKEEKNFALVADTDSAFKEIDKELAAALKDADTELQKLGKKVEAGETKLDKKISASDDRLNKKLAAGDDKLNNKIDTNTKKIIDGMDRYADSVEDAIADWSDRIKKKTDKLNAEIKRVEKEAKTEAKTLVKKKQVQNLVNDLNKEFDGMKDELDELFKQHKDQRKNLASKDDLAAAFSGLGGSLKTLQDQTKKQIDDMDAQHVEEIKQLKGTLKKDKDDFNARLKSETGLLGKKIKQNSQDLDELEKNAKKEISKTVMQQELSGELDAIQKEFENTHEDIKKIQQEMFDQKDLKDMNKRLKYHMIQSKEQFVQKKHFEKLSDTVDRIQDLVEMQQEAVKDKKKQLRSKNKELKVYAKELRAQKKAIRRSEKEGLAVERSYERPETGDYRKTRFLGNFLVGAAFVLVAGAIVLFFSGLSGYTDVLSMAAVVCFVLGIILKIVVAIKGNGNGKDAYRDKIVKAHRKKAKKTKKKAKKTKKKAKKTRKAKSTKKAKKRPKKKKPSKKGKKKVKKRKTTKKKAKKPKRKATKRRRR